MRTATIFVGVGIILVGTNLFLCKTCELSLELCDQSGEYKGLEELEEEWRGMWDEKGMGF